MRYIATTFAHGNGPYARTVDWAIELNDVKQENGLARLTVVVPLVYPGRQERILREEIELSKPGFLMQNSDEILFDRVYGEMLGRLMFKGNDCAENLEMLAREYQKAEAEIRKHFDGRRQVEILDGRKSELDLRDTELQLGLNNRMQTGLPNQFYTAGGAGPFDEILERAIADDEVKIDKKTMKKALPIARKMIENQRVIFSNNPGVFSYDSGRKLRGNEASTPPFIHPPKRDLTKLSGKGIYLLATGIDGIRESGMYDAAAELGMQLYAPEFSIAGLPAALRSRVFPLSPSQINNPDIIGQYARAGWSSVWLSHLAEKVFITPKHQEKDDPEILFNQRGIARLGLGAIVDENPRKSLEEVIALAKNAGKFNESLKNNFGTLDGIRYAAKIVAREMGYLGGNGN